MKKTYQKPSIRVRKIETGNLLSASVGVGGNAGVGLGDSSEGVPTSAGAKPYSIFDEPHTHRSSSGLGW